MNTFYRVLGCILLAASIVACEKKEPQPEPEAPEEEGGGGGEVVDPVDPPEEGYDTSIDSPGEFVRFLAGTSADDTATYILSADLDMAGLSITSASGFGGTLNGNEHVISNLVSDSPLFASNAGTICYLSLDESCSFTVTGRIFGSVVGEDKGGTYYAVKSAASVKYTATAAITDYLVVGGLVGASRSVYGITFNACENTGEIKIEAGACSHKAVALGGIVGYVTKGKFDDCVNDGPVTLNALYGDPLGELLDIPANGGISIGGICGRAYDASYDYASSFHKCENLSSGVISLNNTQVDALGSVDAEGYVCVGGICGRGNGTERDSHGAMWKCFNSARIVANARSTGAIYSYKNYLLNVGGLCGGGWYSMCFEACGNDGQIDVAYDGGSFSNEWTSGCVGGICAHQPRNPEGGKYYANFCNSHGKISVSGLGKMNVGGIFGLNGQQIGNQVKNGASITVNLSGGWSFVGGLVGQLSGSAGTYTIKSCTVNADVKNISTARTWVGGIIGRWAGAQTGDSPSLTTHSSTSNRSCIYSGNVYSATSNSSYRYAGLIIGEVSGSGAKVFGESDHKIQGSGTIFDAAGGDSSPVTIHSSNVAEKAIGTKSGSVTIYIDSPTAPPAPTSTLSLMSFNIREGSNWSKRKSGIVSMIKGESPDIIGLQEVKDLDMWDHLTEDHPWDYLTDKLSASYSGIRFGTKTNAILYKSGAVEVSNTGMFYLRDNYNTSGDSWDGYERTVIYATVRDKVSGNYYFYMTTHFPMNDSNGGFAKSTALLESRISALNTNNYPVILMGDFNCVIGNACWDSIKTWMKNTRYSAASIYSTDNQNLYTYNAFGDSSKDRNKVDHIWVSKSITVNSYLTLTQEIRKYGDQDYLSDHYPIIAIIDS